MDSQDTKYLNAFNQFEFIGTRTLKKIRKFFGSYEKAWKAPISQISKIGLKEKTLAELDKKRNTIDPDKEIKRLKKSTIQILTPEDKYYPKLLKEIYDAPEILYYLGNPTAFSSLSLAIVGSRRYTFYGKEVATYFAQELSAKGLTIVSGLALGIDALSHQAAIESGGKTVAVLGSGLDKIYPAANRQLAKEILEKNGILISEYPLGSSAFKYHFPYRNRIISGLSLGVLVVEAAEKSGSLLTATHALEQNREVFAVPGSIFSSRSRGTNHLIKSGAKLVTDPEDILEELDIQNASLYKETKKIVADSPQEETIIHLLKENPQPISRILKKTGLAIANLNSLLTIMEMKGQIKNLGGGIYALKR